MTGKTRRSFLRACCAGAAVGSLGGIQPVRAAASSSDDFVEEQAQYISKYAAEGNWAFGELKPLFDPPSNEDLGTHLVDSVMPSVASFLPGLVGQAVELKETLDWYEAVGKDSGFKQVSDTGCIENGEDTPTGVSGDGLREAKSEVQNVADQFTTVDECAQACVDDPSTENVEELIAEMETLADYLDDFEWVERWSNVDSNEYQGLHPTAPQAAARLQGNAQVVLDVASEFGDVVADQRAAMQDRDYQPFPSAVVVYDRKVDEFRENVPLFGKFTGDSYNIRTENPDGERLSVRWLDTNSSGAVADYELEARDSANADVVLRESTLTDIVDADDSMVAAVDAYKTDEVQVNPNGLGNKITYGVFSTLIRYFGDYL